MISTQHRCVFVHIPKCGGQSIEQAFLDDLGLGWHERAPLLLRPNSDPAKGPPFLSHLTYRQYLEHGYLTPAMRADYFCFALIRNPYRRVESFYRFLGYDCALPFPVFIEKVLPKALRPEAPLFYFLRPQTDFLLDHKDQLAPDLILPLEDPRGIVDCLSRFGLTALPHRNRSRDRSGLRRWMCRMKHLSRGEGTWRFSIDRSIQWTPEAIQSVRNLYQRDFERLGYGVACGPDDDPLPFAR